MEEKYNANQQRNGRNIIADILQTSSWNMLQATGSTECRNYTIKALYTMDDNENALRQRNMNITDENH